MKYNLPRKICKMTQFMKAPYTIMSFIISEVIIMPYDAFPYELPPLPYDYDALEPYIDAETMHIHHDKHYKTYIDNLNKALAPYEAIQKLPLPQLLKNAAYLPKALSTAVIHHGGGVYNHQLYFQTIGPPSGHSVPSGSLARAIDKQYGSFENFKKEFTDRAKAVFGSGYTFLVKTPEGKIKIVNTANQDTPLPQSDCPIFAVDVWEHGYYLKYKNRRDEYLENIWNVIQFDKAEQNYQQCK